MLVSDKQAIKQVIISVLNIRPCLAGDVHELRQANDRIRSQLHEAQQREKLLVRRLTAKEQETQDYVVSIWRDQRIMFLTMCL